MKNYENEKSQHLALALMNATNKGDIKISKEFADNLLGEFDFIYSKAYPIPIAQHSLSGSDAKTSTPKLKMCSECGKYPADTPSKLCCGCNDYKLHF